MPYQATHWATEPTRQAIDALAARSLVVWLSPAGRGRMLTHGLLPEEKLEKVRSQVGLAAAAATQAPAAGDVDNGELETGGNSRGGGDSPAGTGPAAESLGARVDRLEDAHQLAAREDPRGG